MHDRPRARHGAVILAIAEPFPRRVVVGRRHRHGRRRARARRGAHRPRWARGAWRGGTASSPVARPRRGTARRHVAGRRRRRSRKGRVAAGAADRARAVRELRRGAPRGDRQTAQWAHIDINNVIVVVVVTGVVAMVGREPSRELVLVIVAKLCRRKGLLVAREVLRRGRDGSILVIVVPTVTVVVARRPCIVRGRRGGGSSWGKRAAEIVNIKNE
jgi:hypothetical protein